MVVGTKLDLVNEREVPRHMVQSLSSKWDLPFYETSAKRNWHIGDAFEDLVRQMRTQSSGDGGGGKKKKGGGCFIM